MDETRDEHLSMIAAEQLPSRTQHISVAGRNASLVLHVHFCDVFTFFLVLSSDGTCFHALNSEQP